MYFWTSQVRLISMVDIVSTNDASESKNKAIGAVYRDFNESILTIFDECVQFYYNREIFFTTGVFFFFLFFFIQLLALCAASELS